MLLADEPLTGLAAFCVVCGEVKEGVRTQHFATAPQFLFFQLMRFVQTEDGVVKKQAKVLCSSKIIVPVKRDWCEEVELCSYKLTAIISHVGGITSSRVSTKPREIFLYVMMLLLIKGGFLKIGMRIY